MLSDNFSLFHFVDKVKPLIVLGCPVELDVWQLDIENIKMHGRLSRWLA